MDDGIHLYKKYALKISIPGFKIHEEDMTHEERL